MFLPGDPHLEFSVTIVALQWVSSRIVYDVTVFRDGFVILLLCLLMSVFNVSPQIVLSDKCFVAKGAWNPYLFVDSSLVHVQFIWMFIDPITI